MAAAVETLDEVLKSLSDVLFPADLGEHPVAIDSHGYDGDTPLHVLAWRNDLERAEILVRAGADVNAIGEMDETPLHVALTQRNPGMVQLFLRAGARGDLRCEFGDTPEERALVMGEEYAKLFRANDT